MYPLFPFFKFTILVPGQPLSKKHENHKKSYMVIMVNMKVIESSIEVYGMVTCKS